MPYIISGIREWFDPHIEKMFDHEPLTVGDVNYIVTKVMLRYVNQSKNTSMAFMSKYTAGAMVIGTVICAVLEFYRRFLVPHEKLKIEENGDVYPD
jgi:hypothetical protein